MSSLFRKTPLLLAARYDALVAEGRIVRDEAQWAAVGALDRLIGELEAQRRPRLPFSRNNPPHGLYLWGEIGRGKTTLMDLFFEAAPVRRKRRTHFHAFMREVHNRLHAARRAGNGGADPLTSVAAALTRETRLLCFDEFAVSDIADATILARLFSTLLAEGVVVVATSNVAPRELYKGGRNRDLFLPFIHLVERRLEIVQLDASKDFRLSKRRAEEVFFLAGDAEAARRARARFDAAPYERRTLAIGARRLEIARANGGTARFDFQEICGRPLGAADYLGIAEAFDTVIISDVPQMAFEQRNEARRFITLVDILYEAKLRLILSAEAEPGHLYEAEHGTEVWDIRRTASRLVEMRSQDYLDAWAARCPVSAQPNVAIHK
ncbi:MAG: cell division protein ZapE [Methylocystis sp.]